MRRAGHSFSTGHFKTAVVAVVLASSTKFHVVFVVTEGTVIVFVDAGVVGNSSVVVGDGEAVVVVVGNSGVVVGDGGAVVVVVGDGNGGGRDGVIVVVDGCLVVGHGSVAGDDGVVIVVKNNLQIR